LQGLFLHYYFQVVDDSRKWWKARNCRGQVAHVPHTIVTPYQGGDPSDVFSNPLYAPPHGYDKHYPSQVSTFMKLNSEMLSGKLWWTLKFSFAIKKSSANLCINLAIVYLHVQS
jgi:hypothetical protein